MDLSNCTVKFIVKKNKTVEDTDALLHYDYVQPETNCLLYQFNSSQTSGLPIGSAVCGIKIFRGSEDAGLDQEVWTDEVTIDDGVFN
jgi:hypothetical protein